VVFAMLASYVLSRTLVPVLVNYLLGAEHSFEGQTTGEVLTANAGGFFRRINDRFNQGYTWLQHRYTSTLESFLAHRQRYHYAQPLIQLVSMLDGIDASFCHGRLQIFDSVVRETHDSSHAGGGIHGDLLEAEAGGEPQFGNDGALHHAGSPFIARRR